MTKQEKRLRILKTLLPRITLIIFCIMVCVSSHTPRASSQAIEGLSRGEKDTMRVDLRIDGKQEQDTGRRLIDQRIGWEQKMLKKEMKERELLRKEEEVAKRRRARLEREERERFERRQKEQQRIMEKKREFRTRLGIE